MNISWKIVLIEIKKTNDLILNYLYKDFRIVDMIFGSMPAVNIRYVDPCCTEKGADEILNSFSFCKFKRTQKQAP